MVWEGKKWNVFFLLNHPLSNENPLKEMTLGEEAIIPSMQG